MIYKPISAPLLPSAGYIGNLIDVFFVFVYHKVYFGHSIKNNILIRSFLEL